MLLGNLLFLLLQITRHLNKLHTVKKRTRNTLNGIGGSDKQHLAQVVIPVEIIVMKRLILLGVEDFQQGRGRVTMVISTHLINLIEHKNGIVKAYLFEVGNDASRHGANIGAPVSAKL